MSGLCGVVGLRADWTTHAILETMLQSIRHRGPDQKSAYANPDEGIALGQVHLNSFTVDPGSSRCGFVRADGLAAAVDGCVMNRAEIEPRLQRVTMSGDPDPSARIVAGAYRTFGRGFLEELDGPFSVALWDRSKRELVLSRDKLGERSMYYYIDEKQQHIVFASEIKAILTHPAVHPELDTESLSLHFAFGYVPGPRTLFKNIYKLLPGQSLRFQPGTRLATNTYWHLPPITDDVQDEALAIRRLRELFMSALERYVDGAQEVGVFLSGGIDSSILVTALSELGVPRISTFTIGFTLDPSKPQTDDLHYARLIADQYATRHHEILVEPGHTPESRLLRVVRQFDDLVMTPNSYSKCLLAEAARDAGVRSIVTGSAAAGACGIHRQFLDRKWRAKWLQRTEGCKTDEERYSVLRGRLFPLEKQKSLFRQQPPIDRQDLIEALHHYVGNVKGDDFFRRFLFSNLMITSTEKSVRVLDKVGMMSSVEMRAPYMDRALVEFSTQLPPSFDGGKTFVSLKTHMQKAFEKELPREVLERKVIGYPSYYWQNGELEDYRKQLLGRESIESNGVFDYAGVQAVLEDEKHSDAKSAGKHTWALIQFCLWYEIHVKKNPDFAIATATT